MSGGQGVYVHYLSRGLRDLGHEVTVVSGPPYPELDEGVDLVRLPSLDFFSRLDESLAVMCDIRSPIDLYEYVAVKGGFFPEPLTFGMRVFQYLRQHNGFDVVHDNQSLHYGLLGLQRLGYPVVATVHHPIHIDRDYALAAAGSSWSELLKLRRWYSFLGMQAFVSRRLPLLISVSESARRESGRAFNVPTERIHTVYNGVDAEEFCMSPQARRHPSRVLVVNSADTPLKGLDHLYGALERLVCRRPVEVHIVGQPKDPERTQRELCRRGIDRHVHFLGKLDREQLVEAYSTATVAVLPSLYEGFGLPAAEAMACEAPVVAYRAGALPEVVGTDGAAGLLAPKGDQEALAHAIGTLLDDPDRAMRMGLAGRERVVRRFNWDRTARETAALYEEAGARSR